jgi:hypothetical protein
MRRILCIAALSCAAFAAAPVAYATTVTPDVQTSYKGQRIFLISVGDRFGVLQCTPGEIPAGQRGACAALARVGGNPARLSGSSNAACAMDYQPVTVRAWGTWDGSQYRYSETFSNACHLAVATGPVFRF